jgi:two-component system, cell cycle sensor histidine kinase and response regulator CckA
MEQYFSTFFPNGHEKAILLADDYPTGLQVAAEHLIRFGFRVITATNGHEAMQIYRERKEEILFVISDIRMPIMNGDELFWKLREIDEGARIVLMTGNREGLNLDSFFNAGLKGLLDKPFSPEELACAVFSALM